MTRVSLTEDYDDRSVISKLNEMDKRVKENASVVTSAEASARQSAESAQETADRFAGSVGAVVQNANAQINASKAQVDQAKAEVDETVTTVAQAVQTANTAVANANSASASAQASAQIVAGYENRLGAVETGLGQTESDLDAVTLRVTTAEGQIVTIQGRVTALETADGQNVKINRINDYAVGLTGNQSGITGNKGFLGNIQVGDNEHPLTGGFVVVTNSAYRRIRLQNIAEDVNVLPAQTVGYPIIAWTDVNDQNVGTLLVQRMTDGKSRLVASLRNTDGTQKTVILGASD